MYCKGMAIWMLGLQLSAAERAPAVDQQRWISARNRSSQELTSRTAPAPQIRARSSTSSRVPRCDAVQFSSVHVSQKSRQANRLVYRDYSPASAGRRSPYSTHPPLTDMHRVILLGATHPAWRARAATMSCHTARRSNGTLPPPNFARCVTMTRIVASRWYSSTFTSTALKRTCRERVRMHPRAAWETRRQDE